MTPLSQHDITGTARPACPASAAKGAAAIAPLVSGRQRAVGRMVLLAGATRQPQLRQATKRIPAMLPVDSDHSVLDLWLKQISDLAAAYDVQRVDTRLLVDKKARASLPGADHGGAALTIQTDPDEYRGTGGLLRDVAADMDDDDWIFGISAGQIIFSQLTDVFDRLDGVEGDVVVAANRDGSPSGFVLIRACTLRGINPIGFVDLKEQALPEIARHHQVGVANFAEAPAMPIRERPSYLAAMRRYHRAKAGLSWTEPFEEAWRPAFSVCEPNAQVASGAIVQDSVVLDGGRVESGAVVVRSVICPGAVVGRKQRMVDRIVGPTRTS